MLKIRHVNTLYLINKKYSLDFIYYIGSNVVCDISSICF